MYIFKIDFKNNIFFLLKMFSIYSFCNEKYNQLYSSLFTPKYSQKEKLINNLKENSDIITGMTIWNPTEQRQYILKYEYKKFVLETKNANEDKEYSFINSGPNSALFEDIVNACYPFQDFAIDVRREILPHPKYSDREILGNRKPIEITGWDIINEVNDQYYGVTRLVFKKID